MGWKDWSYARKGGVISLIFGFISLISFQIYIFLSNIESPFLITFIFYFLSIPVLAIYVGFNFVLEAIFFNCYFGFHNNYWGQLCNLSPTTSIFLSVSSVILTTIIFFLIGAGIGKIIEKIKSRNQ